MTKRKITKGVLLSLLFGVFGVLFFLAAFVTSPYPASGLAPLIFNVPPVNLTDLFSSNFGQVFSNAVTQTWWPAIQNWGKEWVNWITYMFGGANGSWYASPNWTNNIIFYVFVLVIAVYILLALYYLIWGLFVYKKKKSSILNIIWTAIPVFCISFLLVGLHGAIYGADSYLASGAGNAATGPIYTYFAQIMNITQNDALTMNTKLKAWGLLISFVIFGIFFIALLWQGIKNVMIGTPRYLSAHKYDYIEKAEKKRRKEFYKNHGYENIANQSTDKASKKERKSKKGDDYESNNPYVQQQQAAMGYTGQQNGQYMNPYPYGYGAPAYGQVNTIPASGNTVHTGNNAPLIVQYISNGHETNDLKANKIDDNTTSIYGTSRVQRPQPAYQQEKGLTKDDIKSAVYDILKENNLITNEQAEAAAAKVEAAQPTHEYSLEDEYDVLTLDDLKTLIKDSVKELVPQESNTETKNVEAKPSNFTADRLDESLTSNNDCMCNCNCNCGCNCHDNCQCGCSCGCDCGSNCNCCESKSSCVAQQVAERIVPPVVVAIPAKIEEIEEDTTPNQDVQESVDNDDAIDEDALRSLISSQLAEALKTVQVEEKQTVQEVPVYVKEVPVVQPQQIIKEIVKVVPTVKEIVKEVHVPVEKTVEAIKEIPVVQEVVQPKVPLIKQPDVRGKEKELEKVEAVKLNFQEKLLTSGSDIVLAYNSLKNLLMSYGLKDRLSNSGDTFRLHKNTYCKITMGGSHLKIYLALDPKNYLNTAIPVGDASFKELYRDIPLVFRVKSDTSLQRARELIKDCMNTKGLTQVSEEGNIDYASQLKNK